MHIPHHNNNNKAIVDCNNEIVPLCYFNIVKLSVGESFTYQLSDYETCIVPATGSVDVQVQGQTLKQLENETIFGKLTLKVSMFQSVVKLN